MRSITKGLRGVAAIALVLAIFAGGTEAQDGPKRVRIGGDVQQAKLVKNSAPVYPILAKRARIEGTVRLQVIVAKDGTVQKVEVMSGHAVLAQSAVEAVQKWRYKPTEMNGEAVEVVTSIDIVFKL